jgi:uncharacterized protein YbjT (DUF2867 family)
VQSRAGKARVGYFAAKAAAEQVVAASGLGWTTLRAAQFHDLILMVACQLARLPVILWGSITRSCLFDRRDLAVLATGIIAA